MRILPRLSALFLLMLLLLGSQRASATHNMGGQIAYEHLTGIQYRVLLTLYNSELSIVRQDYVDLNFRANGCTSSDSRNFTLHVARNLTVRHDAPFALSKGLYYINTYEATVELPPAIWILSTMLPNRTPVDNIGGESSFFYPLYLEATVNTTLASANSSPVFYDLPVPQMFWQRQDRYAFGATDAENDSLVYTLTAPLSDCQQVVPYNTYPAGSLINPITAQSFSYPAGQYTAEFPLPSFQLIATGTTSTAVPAVEFNRETGAITLFPAPTQSGRSHFAVAVRVDEFRRINGSYVKIGSVMKEVPFVFYNPVSSFNPTLTELRVNKETTSRPLSSTIKVLGGQPLTLHFAATDPDPGQQIRFYADLTALPGAVLASTGTGEATLQWQPNAQIQPGFYRFPLTIVDDDAPLSGSETRIITLRVTNAVLATHDRQPLRGAAYPLPFTDQVTIQLPTPGRQPLRVLDALGRLVDQLVSGPDGTVVWRPAAAVAPGTYFLRTASGQVVKLVRAGQ